MTHLNRHGPREISLPFTPKKLRGLISVHRGYKATKKQYYNHIDTTYNAHGNEIHGIGIRMSALSKFGHDLFWSSLTSRRLCLLQGTARNSTEKMKKGRKNIRFVGRHVPTNFYEILDLC